MLRVRYLSAYHLRIWEEENGDARRSSEPCLRLQMMSLLVTALLLLLTWDRHYLLEASILFLEALIVQPGLDLVLLQPTCLQ